MTAIFAYFGITDFAKAGQMTLTEFKFRQRAHLLKELDRDREIHLQAYLNRVAKATTRDGKSYQFKSFEDFYNHEKLKEQVLGRKNQIPVEESLIERARRLQKIKKGGIDGG